MEGCTRPENVFGQRRQPSSQGRSLLAADGRRDAQIVFARAWVLG